MLSLLVADPSDLGGLLRDLLAALQAGAPSLVVAGILLVFLVGALKMLLGWKIPWFKTRTGKYILAFGSAAAATIGGALADGQGFSITLVIAAISVALTAGKIHSMSIEMIDKLKKEASVIEWLLGGTTAIGAIGTVIVAIYALRIADRGRDDTRALVKRTEELGTERIARAATEETARNLSEVIGQQKDELAREAAGRAELYAALERATEELAKSATPSSAVASLRGALDRLRQLPSVPTAERATDNHDPGVVHGPAAAVDHTPGNPDRDP